MPAPRYLRGRIEDTSDLRCRGGVQQFGEGLSAVLCAWHDRHESPATEAQEADVPQRRPLQIVSDGDIVWESGAFAAPEISPPDPVVTPRRPRRRRPSRATILRRRLVALAVAVLAVYSVVQLLNAVRGNAGPTARNVPAVLGTSVLPGHTAAPKSAAAPAGLTAVSKGDRGRAVKAVQIALATLGYDAGAADGIYQQGTMTAVSRFQRDHGLPVTGAAGEQTLDALAKGLSDRVRQDVGTIRGGIDGARRDGRLQADEARQAQTELQAIAAAAVKLRFDAQATVIAALADVAANASGLDTARTRALMGMLAANVKYLQSRPVPAAMSTIHDADRIAYRLFTGHGFQFHPLASFGELNSLVSKGDKAAAHRLAAALVQRGEQQDGGLVWEYYFPFGGGAPWTSGFAQAVAANALQRASDLTGDGKLAGAAAAAFRTIPRAYLHPLNGGQWILEYGHSSMLILNAQMESLLMISEYARASGNAGARTLAREMLTATRATLPALDLGCWSLYSVGGNRATVDYHTYHISLLRRLADLTGIAMFRDVATRWSKGLHGTC
jgi:hypothetical protein